MIKRFKSYFKRSIKNRMIITITFSLIIPLTIITFLSYIRSSNSMEEEIIKSNTKSIIWTGKYIDKTTDKTIVQQSVVLFSFLVDVNLSSNVRRSVDDNYSVQVSSKDYILNKLSSLLYSNSSYNGLLLFDESKMQLFYVTPEKTGINWLKLQGN